MSILIPGQGMLERRDCRKSELITWFQGVELRAWLSLGIEFPKEDPEEIFLITGQTMASECWISHKKSNDICSIWIENLVHRLPLPTRESAWIGDDLFEVKARDGFQIYNGGATVRTIFLTRSLSQRPKDIYKTLLIPKPTLGLSFISSPDGDKFSPKGDFDIIFVHGLGGSAWTSWTHPGTKWFWPKHLYGKKGFQNARILTFGYNSHLANVFRPSNKLDLHDFSLQLLNGIYLHHREHGAV